MKNRASAITGLLIALMTSVAASASYGQVYKWVDSNGRVNYSSQAPADSDSTKSVKVVEPNISVYTPDESLKRAVEEYRQGKNYQLASESVYAVAARSACADSGMPPLPGGGCQSADNGSSDYYPNFSFAPAVVYGRLRRRPAPLFQAQIPPGTIAGNVVGMNGFIAGNSALVPTVPASTRSPRPSFASRGFAPR